MTSIPTIEHTTTIPAGEGFSAAPIIDTPGGHSAFQTAVKSFTSEHLHWERVSTNSGRYGFWDRAIFIPYLD